MYLRYFIKCKYKLKCYSAQHFAIIKYVSCSPFLGTKQKDRK